MSTEKSSVFVRAGKVSHGTFSTSYPKEFFDALDRIVEFHDVFKLVMEIGLAFQKDKHKLAKDIRTYLRGKIPKVTLWRWLKPLEDEHKKENKLNKRQELINQAQASKLPLDCYLYRGDFRDPEILKNIPNESIDLIFVDPPYDAKSIPIYKAMVDELKIKLKSGGSIVSYFGQYMLIEFAKHMETKGLTYWWLFCVQHTGAKASFYSRKIFVGWKPLLWFVKGDKPAMFGFIDDFIESTPPDKVEHDWEQSTVEAEHVIKGLTVEGMKVLDPMMGSGTTGIAALKLKRQFIGIELDEKKFNIAKSHIARN